MRVDRHCGHRGRASKAYRPPQWSQGLRSASARPSYSERSYSPWRNSCCSAIHFLRVGNPRPGLSAKGRGTAQVFPRDRQRSSSNRMPPPHPILNDAAPQCVQVHSKSCPIAVSLLLVVVSRTGCRWCRERETADFCRPRLGREPAPDRTRHKIVVIEHCGIGREPLGHLHWKCLSQPGDCCVRYTNHPSSEGTSSFRHYKHSPFIGRSRLSDKTWWASCKRRHRRDHGRASVTRAGR